MVAEAILEASGSTWRYVEPLHLGMVFQTSEPIGLLMVQKDATLVEPLLLQLAVEKTPPLVMMVVYLLVALCPSTSPLVTSSLASSLASRHLDTSSWQKLLLPSSCCRLWGPCCLWMLPRPLLVVMVVEPAVEGDAGS